jgi:hypothetical protein
MQKVFSSRCAHERQGQSAVSCLQKQKSEASFTPCKYCVQRNWILLNRQRKIKMEKKSSAFSSIIVTLVMVFLITFVVQFALKYLNQTPSTLSAPIPYMSPQAQEIQPVASYPTTEIQSTVEAFYVAPVVSTPIPTIEIPTQSPSFPSIQLTTCIDSPIFSTTNYGQEYIVGMAAKGLTFDIAERSSDSQWVKLAQSNETYEFWIPAVAFCFAP